MDPSANLFPPPPGIARARREGLQGHRGHVFWLFGLSGAGKSTVAALVEETLVVAGRRVLALDGDRLRTGLNRGLGFSVEDRRENLRRAAEVARLAAQQGQIVLAAFITPLRELRALVRAVVGPEDLTLVFLDTPEAEVRRRDVKGLYARAERGEVAAMTGVSAPFETPAPDEPGVVCLRAHGQDPALSAHALEGLARRLTDLPPTPA